MAKISRQELIATIIPDEQPSITFTTTPSIVAMIHDMCRFIESDNSEAFCVFMERVDNIDPPDRDAITKFVGLLHTIVHVSMLKRMGIEGS